MTGSDFGLLACSPPDLWLTASASLLAEPTPSSDEVSESQDAESSGATGDKGRIELGALVEGLRGLTRGLGNELRTCFLDAARVRLATGMMAAWAGGAGTFSSVSLTSAVVLGTVETLPLEAADAP